MDFSQKNFFFVNFQFYQIFGLAKIIKKKQFTDLFSPF
jgi:hypothetical protein